MRPLPAPPFMQLAMIVLLLFANIVTTKGWDSGFVFWSDNRWSLTWLIEVERTKFIYSDQCTVVCTQ